MDLGQVLNVIEPPQKVHVQILLHVVHRDDVRVQLEEDDQVCAREVFVLQVRLRVQLFVVVLVRGGYCGENI